MEDSPIFEGSQGDGSADQTEELKLVTSILSQLARVDLPARERIIETVATFFGVTLRGRPRLSNQQPSPIDDKPFGQPTFSEDRSISPKQFLFEKQPSTDVERVACLAYYLTHYKGVQHFKTLDISKLNTEAAQMKFANAADSVENAVKRNYLAPATKGSKQLSALGEQFVHALPDREKARAIMAAARPRRKSRRPDESGAN